MRVACFAAFAPRQIAVVPRRQPTCHGSAVRGCRLGTTLCRGAIFCVAASSIEPRRTRSCVLPASASRVSGPAAPDNTEPYTTAVTAFTEAFEQHGEDLENFIVQPQTWKKELENAAMKVVQLGVGTGGVKPSAGGKKQPDATNKKPTGKGDDEAHRTCAALGNHSIIRHEK